MGSPDRLELLLACRLPETKDQPGNPTKTEREDVPGRGVLQFQGKSHMIAYSPIFILLVGWFQHNSVPLNNEPKGLDMA